VNVAPRSAPPNGGPPSCGRARGCHVSCPSSAPAQPKAAAVDFSGVLSGTPGARGEPRTWSPRITTQLDPVSGRSSGAGGDVPAGRSAGGFSRRQDSFTFSTSPFTQGCSSPGSS